MNEWLQAWSKGDLVFASPQLLWLLLALPFLALLQSRRGGAPAVIFSSLAGLRKLGEPRRARLGGFFPGLLLCSLAVLILALARPQRAHVTSRINPSGVDIMLAIDVSGSMMATDITIGDDRAYRLEAVKKVTEDFINARKADRIGMVAFAGVPFMVSPLTLNHEWLVRNLSRVRVGLVTDGTAIGSAIASAANRLKNRKESKSKIIVLLTDGDNNAGDISPMQATTAAKELGIKLYAVGVGSRHMARMLQVDPNTGQPLRGYFGPVSGGYTAPMDETTLKQIAAVGDGKFFRATDADSLQQIFEQIDKLEKTEVQLTETRIFDDLFPWFLAVGATLAGLHALFTHVLQRRLP